MHDTLNDIKEKLKHGKYRNEEHVRLSLVCRLLWEIGWDIWNPEEVNTEFPANPNEDKTKVDIALFVNDFSIFIEVKAVGKILHLVDVEKQVRDYNRDNTALFSVITDGRSWRLYYSQTGGKFCEKCFKEYDLLDDDLEEIENAFFLFFSKESIENGRAKDEADKYLQLTNKQKAVQDALPQAKRLLDKSPFPDLPKATANVLTKKNKHHNISEREIIEILNRMPETSSPPPTEPIVAHSKSQHSKQEIPLPTDSEHTDFTNTRVVGTIQEKQGKGWRKLLNIAIKLAVQAGFGVDELMACSINVKEGEHTDRGFSPVNGLSWQRMDSNHSKKALLQIAKKLNFQLKLTITWHEKSPHAGEKRIVQWPP